jgi:hypothetical protein
MKSLSGVLEVLFIGAVGQARFLDQSVLPMPVDSKNFVEPIERVERKKEIRKCYKIEKG